MVRSFGLLLFAIWSLLSTVCLAEVNLLSEQALTKAAHSLPTLPKFTLPASQGQ